jgi:hypothetical protein
VHPNRRTSISQQGAPPPRASRSPSTYRSQGNSPPGQFSGPGGDPGRGGRDRTTTRGIPAPAASSSIHPLRSRSIYPYASRHRPHSPTSTGPISTHPTLTSPTHTNASTPTGKRSASFRTQEVIDIQRPRGRMSDSPDHGRLTPAQAVISHRHPFSCPVLPLLPLATRTARPLPQCSDQAARRLTASPRRAV